MIPLSLGEIAAVVGGTVEGDGAEGRRRIAALGEMRELAAALA